LSLYLFILTIDTLQHVLQKATQEGLLTPLRDQTARLRLSLYVDDVVVFLNPIKEYVDTLMTIMQKFGEATWLKININKSTVAPIQCAAIDLQPDLQSFSGERLSYPISYLGLPITLGWLKLVHLQPILDQASSRLSGWQGRLMNLDGRRELVKTVLSSLPTYLLTALKAPKKFYKAIDEVRRRFLWARIQ
jgi:hypothetical protein